MIHLWPPKQVHPLSYVLLHAVRTPKSLQSILIHATTLKCSQANARLPTKPNPARFSVQIEENIDYKIGLQAQRMCQDSRKVRFCSRQGY